MLYGESRIFWRDFDLHMVPKKSFENLFPVSCWFCALCHWNDKAKTLQVNAMQMANLTIVAFFLGLERYFVRKMFIIALFEQTLAI